MGLWGVDSTTQALVRHAYEPSSHHEPAKENAPSRGLLGAFRCNSLTMSYFHTGTRTIIGAKAFHCPVRDGKEWDHLAMVIRLNLLPRRLVGRRGQFIESVISVFMGLI